MVTSPYIIPEKLNTVKDIIKHWNDEVVAKGDIRNTKWRYYLLDAQKKRFTRMRRIVWCYRTQILTYPMIEEEVLRGFE